MPPQTTARAPFDKKHFVVVALTEAAALAAAALRLALSNGAIGLEKPAHLAWFLTTVGIATLSVVQFSVRSSILRQRDLRGDDTTDARKGVLATSVAMAAGALVLALLGPMPFERVIGA
ncbi:MAG: hypothetical protein GQE15_38330 [Archangiaceae bacterium]|nr:hypothetical protein [Archangiaceae bacterium]